MQKRISPNAAKFLTSLSVGIVITIFVLILSNIVMNRALRVSEKRYLDSCEQILKGYSNSIQLYIENYRTSLNSINNKKIFTSGSKDEIQEWLSKIDLSCYEDFSAIYFVDSEGMAYFTSGETEDLSDRTYLAKRTDASTSYFISDIFNTPFTDEPIIIIKQTIFSDNKKYCGSLCAAIEVNKFQKITDKIKIGNNCKVYLQDSNGIFVVHPDQKYVGKTYSPADEKYSHISSQAVSNSFSGFVETQDHENEIVDLFYSKIPECEWTMAISFPKSELESIFHQQKTTRILIVISCFIALIILLIIENIVLDCFYKRQLINTDYDSLTKLWTRQRFEIEATKLLRRYPKSKFMLVESDIRGFKFINQNYGEESADKMIYFYSALLNDITNDFHGIIGRGYADHFYTFVKITEVRKAMSVFKKAMEKVTEEVKKYDIQFFPKFGIAFLMPDNTNRDVTIQGLIGQASFAKSTIKDNLLTQYSIYNSRLLEQINREHFIENSMESAIEKNEFFVMYQPKIRLSDDKIVGAEALVRWRTTDMGLLTPDKFIPLFERNGFITKLDFYVYEQVFKFINNQIKEKNHIVPVSVNMSRNHSKPDKFMHDFMEIFNKYEIPPHLIQVEILERSFMDSETLKEITNQLHREGFSVAMDDFGSGESSLNMLTKIPVDVLKFDRDFLLSSTTETGMLESKAAKFIEILINLSKHLEKQTVFEGVETQAQRDFLRSIECDQAQGYFYSKPLAEPDFIQFIKMHS